MTLTWWEYEELLEHMQSRPDIWMYDEDSKFWLRTSHEGDPCCALRFRGPSNAGPYRQFLVEEIPMGWSGEETSEFTLDLCAGWTGYGARLSVVKLLTEDEGIKMDPRTAMAVAIGIGRIYQDPYAEEVEARPVQARLVDVGSGFYSNPEPDRRLFPITGGGFASLTPRAGMIKADFSLRTGEGYEGTMQLTGFVRPRNGKILRALHLLFGVPEGDPKSEAECSQLNFPTEA